MRTMIRICRVPLVTALLVVSLAACSGSDAKKPASQVAAKVNSQEISVHQINFALARANAANIPPEQASKVRQEVLNKLIDQQLVVEKAVDKKLDRSPNVMMALEQSRQEILARAYFEQLSSGIAQPTPDEAKKYYSEHPQLFAERNIFTIQEITLPGGDKAVADQMRDMLNGGKSMDEIAGWLKEKDIKFTGGSAERAAEQIPLELLPRVQALKAGQGMVIQGPASTIVMRVAAIRPAPVTEEQALPSIGKFLSNQRLKEQMTSEMKQLRDKARISFVGEFADADKAAAAPAAEEKKPASAEAAPAAGTDAALEKGVAGLK